MNFATRSKGALSRDKLGISSRIFFDDKLFFCRYFITPEQWNYLNSTPVSDAIIKRTTSNHVETESN